jgi:predicted nucleic acid-binding protein
MLHLPYVVEILHVLKHRFDPGPRYHLRAHIIAVCFLTENGVGLPRETRGPRVSDAWFAALAIEWGCEWITLDRDYARFPGLAWQVPDARATG